MEEWRDVPGFEGLYQISIATKEGKCRRFYKNGNIKLKSNTPCSRDHRINWSLSKGHKAICKQAAVWIALTFPELIQNEYFEGAEIDHIDTNRLNNHPSNLRWVTKSGNQNNPLTKLHHKEALTNRPDCSKGVIQLSVDDVVLHYYPSTMQAERETGIKRTAIGACCRGKAVKDKDGFYYTPKTAGGYKWKYAE